MKHKVYLTYVSWAVAYPCRKPHFVQVSNIVSHIVLNLGILWIFASFEHQPTKYHAF